MAASVVNHMFWEPEVIETLPHYSETGNTYNQGEFEIKTLATKKMSSIEFQSSFQTMFFSNYDRNELYYIVAIPSPPIDQLFNNISPIIVCKYCIPEPTEYIFYFNRKNIKHHYCI